MVTFPPERHRRDSAVAARESNVLGRCPDRNIAGAHRRVSQRTGPVDNFTDLPELVGDCRFNLGEATDLMEFVIFCKV
jgi:hypothetical protein